MWPHGLQHTTLLCPPLSPRVCSNSCPLSQWCYLTISPSHPPSPPSPLALNFSQHQGLSQWVGSLHQVAKVLFELQQQSFQWILRVWLSLGLTTLISLKSKELSRIFSNTTVQKHQFFSAQSSPLARVTIINTCIVGKLQDHTKC